MKPITILQARMASRRLPRKAMAWLGRKSVLRHCLDWLRADSTMPVVLATTTRPDDDVLAQEGARAGVRVFRGADEDVLERFLSVARLTGATHVVRATADNPAVDFDAAARVLEIVRCTGADYVVESDLPYGAAVEAVSVDALERAWPLAVSAAEREHVTTVVRFNPRFNAVLVPAPAELRRPDLRLTIDTADDLAFMRRLRRQLGEPSAEPHLTDIIAAADAVLANGVVD